MAEATVSVLNKLASLTIQQRSGGEHGALENIRNIQNKLEDVRCLLRDAETEADENEGVKETIRQLTQICYEVEDTLDDIPRPDNQRFSILEKTIRTMTLGHRLEHKMARVPGRLDEISKIFKGCPSIQRLAKDELAKDETILPRSAAADDDGRDDVVGTEKAESYLIDRLLDQEPRLTAVSVVGMGGSGKTTVAKRVYNSPRVRNHFDCHAWISASQDFEIQCLCRQLAPTEDSSSSSPPSKTYLAACLKKQRFLIVLDDVWHVDVWESLRNALPVGQLGSRVLITTRMRDVALSTYGPVYELQFLKMDESRTLFHRKAFPSAGVCPDKQLTDIADKILRRCGGLPLAITVVGALLSSKGPDAAKWEAVLRSFSSQMEANPYFQAQMRALKLSYRDLPYGLRSCFLYLILFPDNAPIRFSKLARLWAAERLLQTSNSDHSVEEAEAAEGCLSALVRRSLVQVSDSYDDGRVRSCQVHDIIREMILPIAKEWDFAAAASSRAAAGDVQSFQNVRRISISNKNNSDDVSQHLELGGFRRLRSLLISGRFQSLERSLHSATPSWRLLRVFDLEGTTLQSFPIGIENLVFLRYLSFRNTNITEFPKSLSKLVRLETLDLRGNQISSLPAQIAKLEALRHLLVGSRAEKGVVIPPEIGKLTKLRTLKYIDIHDKQTQGSELGNLTQIRSLCLSNWKQGDGSILASSVKQMTHLISFKAASEGDGEIDMDALSSVSSSLQRLHVKGRMNSNKLPDQIPSGSSLVKIHLEGSGLSTDPFGVLESLPRLAVLNLVQAYNGEKLCCDNPEGFPELKVLNLVGLHQLHSLRVKKGAMKCLHKLQFDSCDKLQSLPEDIEHLSQLRELGFINANSALIEKIKSHKQTKDAIVYKIIIKPAKRSQPQS